MPFKLKSLLFSLASLAAATAVMLIAPHAMGRALMGTELAVIALFIGAAVARLSLLARKRRRQKLEEMRDSALW